MRIMVAIKQVLEPELSLEPGPDGAGYRPAVAPRYKLNRYDEHAVEQAVRLQEVIGGATSQAVTVGPAGAREVLTRAMGMGLGGAAHILRENPEPAGPAEVAALLAAHAAGKGFDLYLAGAISEDAMNAATGPMLAARLGIPWASFVVEMEPRGDGLYVERELEGGRRQMMLLPFPCLVTVNTSSQQPRYPTLSRLLKAKATLPDQVPADSLAADAPPPITARYQKPGPMRAGRMLAGATGEKARELAAILKQRGLL